MPRAVTILNDDAACRLDVELVEEARLGLPSEIGASRREAVCSPRLREIKAQLREAQCRDALQHLRNQLHTLDHLYQYKKTHVRHQVANTRAREEIATQDTRKQRAAGRYRHARRAKLALSGHGAWERELRELQDSDIRGLQDDDPAAESTRKRARGNKDPGPAEGRRTMSWIWRTSDLSGTEEMIDSLRVEWLKSHARVMRWEEEVKWLVEEMRRVLASHAYDEKEWKGRAQAITSPDPALKEGLVAYAIKQEAIRRRMRATAWRVCVTDVQATPGLDWQADDEWMVPDDTAAYVGIIHHTPVKPQDRYTNSYGNLYEVIRTFRRPREHPPGSAL